jgi:excisionase family DNA binding protein
MPERTYTTHDIARICDVYPSSVVNWIREGKLRSYQTPGGHHRVTREELVAFLGRLQMPMPAGLDPRRRVLIVDDDADLARMLEKAFARRRGWDVETCGDGLEALLRIGGEPPDLVVLDVVLPKMDGVRVCRVLKSSPRTRGIRIVAISGQRPPVSEKTLREVGVDAFFRKPLDLPALLTECGALLGQGARRAG